MFTIFSYFRLISKTYWYYLQHLELIPIIKFSIIWPLIIINLMINNFFLSLDHIFFNFKNILIKTPFFIIGFPRSGTTFLHKSITNDKQFTTPYLWELIFAPSIIQKLVWKKIYRFVNINLANKKFSLIRRFTRRFDNIHEIKLSNPEEDYLTFTPYGACFLLIIIMPIDDIWKLINFDKNFSTKYKNRLMKKYKLFIQRHLYVYGKNKIYLSKNPYFTSLLHTLYKTFPDCNIIGCYRNPQQSIPSLLSNMHEAYLLMSRKITSNNHIDKYILMYKNYYTIMKTEELKNKKFILLKMDDISKNLSDVIANIYKNFNYKLHSDFISIIKTQTNKSKKYISKHKYYLKDYNIDPDYIDNLFFNNE